MLQTNLDIGILRRVSTSVFVFALYVALTSLESATQANAAASNATQATADNPRKIPKPGFSFIQKYPDLQYQIKVFGSGYTAHGYRLLSVRIANEGDKTYSTQLIGRFDGDRMSFVGRHTESATSKMVELGPGSTVKLTVYAPNLTANLDEVRLKLNGREIVLVDRSGSDFTHIIGPYLGGQSSLTFFVSPDIDRDGVKKKINAFGLVGAINSYSFGSRYSRSSHYGSVENLEIIDAPPAKEWEDAWLAYSAFTNVLLTPDFYETLSEPSKDALRDYVTAGGVITFFEFEQLPDRFQGPMGSQERVIESYRGQNSKLKYINFGLGFVCHTTQIATDLNDEDWQGIMSMDRRQFYQSADSGVPERNLKLFEEKGVNKDLIYWGVFFFVVIVGPVNLALCRYYFSNLMLLVITTPVFSVLVSLLFVVGDYIAQGTRPTTVTETFTILDQERNRSITYGRTGFYTPMRAGELKFDLQTEVLPYIGNDTIDRYYYGGRTSESSTIRFEDNAQYLSSGWVQSRKETYFNFRQVKRSDLKIDIQKNAEGNLEMINGLGVEIVRFLYQDDKGKPFQAESIKPGEKVVLERVTGNRLPASESHLPSQMHSLKPTSGRETFNDLFVTGRLGLKTYVAETVTSPFSNRSNNGQLKSLLPVLSTVFLRIPKNDIGRRPATKLRQDDCCRRYQF